jgi:hypothetical protein
MKFKATVTRVDEYEIEVDENVWDKEALKDWSSVFSPVDSVEDVAKDFAVAFMRNDNSYFIEGYGYVKELNKEGALKGVPYRDEKGNFCYPLPEEKYTKGISIKPLSHDYDYETELEKIK